MFIPWNWKGTTWSSTHLFTQSKGVSSKRLEPCVKTNWFLAISSWGDRHQQLRKHGSRTMARGHWLSGQVPGELGGPLLAASPHLAELERKSLTTRLGVCFIQACYWNFWIILYCCEITRTTCIFVARETQCFLASSDRLQTQSTTSSRKKRSLSLPGSKTRNQQSTLPEPLWHMHTVNSWIGELQHSATDRIKELPLQLVFFFLTV